MKTEANKEEVRLLFRSRRDYLFAGVLGGLGYYWNIDSTIIRILFLFLTILTIGLTVIIYFILIKAIPLEPEV